MMNERVYVLCNFSFVSDDKAIFLLVVGSTTITAKYVVSTSYVSPVLKLLYVEFYFLSMCSQSTIICNDLLAWI